MKKKFINTAALLLLMMSAVALNACGGNDDEIEPKPEDTTPVAALMEMTLTVGDDMLSMLDINVRYYDADGRQQTEKMTQKTWKKTVRSTTLPVTLGMTLEAKAKEGVDYSSIELFTASYGYDYKGYAVSATDKMVGNLVGTGTDSKLGMKGEKVLDWLARHQDGLVNIAYQFSKDGKAEKVK